ncbi:hypothetical protein [Chitinophaga arvensicola]|uniref:DUF3592 domain-containing protein n=1 Tax=Chitinophaga arvensicola TaxID=29529 RepID=A0A1I0S6Y8_9BACT|nr:hypothetical protein [Chitinophaga arvensicola]SEW51512.1 hypothetical protein SAMN04488122_4272 [Chitinophaga arvensicola]
MDKKSLAKNIFGYIVLAVISFFFVFVWNPFQLAIYSLLTGLLLYVVYNIRRPEKQRLNRSNLEGYLTYAGFTYLLILLLYSVSPYLRVKEFQWTHPAYHSVEGEISDAAYGVYRQKGNLYGYVDISYRYHVADHYIQQQQKAALRFYSFPIFSNTKGDYLKARVKDQFNEIQQERSYVILVNDAQPERSRFFAGQALFYWSGSIMKNFCSGILFMIAVIGGVGLIAYLFRNYKRPAPANRKSLVKMVWMIVLGILGLFFLIYLVLLIYFKSTGKL